MPASTYERCPLTGGKKCRVLVEKLPGPVNIVNCRNTNGMKMCSLQLYRKFKQLRN